MLQFWRCWGCCRVTKWMKDVEEFAAGNRVEVSFSADDHVGAYDIDFESLLQPQ